MPGALNDFFGGGYLGYDPQAERRLGHLSELTQFQQLLNPQAPKQVGSGQSAGARAARPQAQQPTFDPAMLAQMFGGGGGGASIQGLSAPASTAVRAGKSAGSAAPRDSLFPSVMTLPTPNPAEYSGVSNWPSKQGGGEQVGTEGGANRTRTYPGNVVVPREGGALSGTGGAYPTDLVGLRQLLGNYFSGSQGAWAPQPYGGNLNVPESPYAGQAASMFGQGAQAGLPYLGQGLQGLGGATNMSLAMGGLNTSQGGLNLSNLLLQQGLGGGQQYLENYRGLLNNATNTGMLQQGIGYLNQGLGAGQQYLGGAAGPLQGMQQGGDLGNIQAMLAAIDTSGNQALQGQLAGIREKFGAWGLGQGSDISSALAAGSAQGIADMNKQKQDALLSAWNASQGRSVQALGMAPEFASSAGNPALMAAQLMGSFQGQANSPWAQAMGLMPAYSNAVTQPGIQGAAQASSSALGVGQQGLQTNALGNQNWLSIMNAMPQYANAASGAFNQAGQGMSGLNQAANLLGLQNMQTNYQEFIRNQNPTGWLNAASAYATGFPPSQQVVPEGGNGFLQFLGQVLPSLLKLAL